MWTISTIAALGRFDGVPPEQLVVVAAHQGTHVGHALVPDLDCASFQ